MIKDKQEHSAFVAYRHGASGYEYFLQRRSKDARRNPGYLGLFGGGFEGNEDMLQALMRELNEELRYEPKHPRYFSRYETAGGIVHVFIEEVPADFESLITVCEGEYGKFVTASDFKTETHISHIAGITVNEIETELGRQQ